MICHKSDSSSIETASKFLSEGKICILPTDTVYGFSGIVHDKFMCDEKIREIKGRSESKSFIELISSPEEIFKYTTDKIPEKLINLWPGPLTIIVKDIRKSNLEFNTTAFRCPGDDWLRKIISKLDAPIFSTSVNKSGCPILETEKAILDEFMETVDLIVLDGDKKNALASTIVKIENGNFSVIRQGALKI